VVLHTLRVMKFGIDEGGLYLDRVMGGCTKSGDEVNSPSRLGDSHCFYGPIFLAHNQYFVLGENPDNSIDSRSFGPVPRNTAKGRVLLRFRPSHRFTVFK